MDFEVQQRVTRELRFVTSNARKRTQYMRETGKALQLQQVSWTKLLEISAAADQIKQQERNRLDKIIDASTVELKLRELRDKKASLELEFLKMCRERYDGGERYAYLPGPAGELPLHNCMLLRQSTLAKQLIDEMFTPSIDNFDTSLRDVNIPYVSDLDAWKQMDFLHPLNPYDDGGLFTGETVLHIAVVQEDEDMVQWLIEKKGASVAAKAVGSFFKPRELVRGKKESVVTVLGRKVAVERSQGHQRILHNKESQCDFGEYPFSFAASLGAVKIMALMKSVVMKMADNSTEYLKLVKQYPHKMRVPAANMSPADHLAYLLINAPDTEGNTALHMAVLHNQVTLRPTPSTLHPQLQPSIRLCTWRSSTTR